MADCPFCAIVTGHAPEPKDLRWFEDVETIAFTPLRPFVPGHTLVVPVEHVAHIGAASPEVTGQVMTVAAEVGVGLVSETEAEAFNVITSAGAAATQTVMHWHVHVIPRRPGDPLGPWPWMYRHPEPDGVKVHVDYQPPPLIQGYSSFQMREAYEEGLWKGRRGG